MLLALNLKGDWASYGSVAITLLFVIGCIIATRLINRIGRRCMLLHSFLWSGLALLGLGVFHAGSEATILGLFGAYALFIGGAQVLQLVYPNELFPTEIRAFAVGVGTSLSRVGAAVGTYLVPLSLETLGTAQTMYAAALVTLLGLLEREPSHGYDLKRDYDTFFGRGKPLEGLPIVEGTPWYDKELAHGWNYDPARAKALLAEAGFANGFQTTLLATAQFGMHKDTAEIVQQYLAAIGIQAELQLPDWSTRVSRGSRGQYDIAIHGVSSDNNDPDGLTVVLDTSLSPSHGRSFKVDAPRTVAALARGRAEFDQAKRVEIYKEMQRVALEEVPLVGLAWRQQGYGMDKGVKGFTNLPGALSNSSGNMLEETRFG